MKILYLAYAPQNSFDFFCKNFKTNFSWIDSLLSKLVRTSNISIALAVPIAQNNYQKKQKGNITLYSLPNPKNHNIFKKAYIKLTRNRTNYEINTFVHRVIDDFKPDIIQIFGSENPFGLIITQQTIPVILHIQGNMSVVLKKWFTGISAYEQIRYSSLKRILLMQDQYNSFLEFKKRVEIEQEILSNCKYFLGRTDFDKRLISLFSPASSYFHCEELIREEFFENKWELPLQKEIICISILKGTTYKGLDLLIETLLILNKYSNFSFKFRICGISSNESIVKTINKKFNRILRHLNIQFLGKLSTDNLIKQLCNSNFYIHPSYIENSPNSVCEAMALGMPVISTNVGGINSLIDNKIEGLLIQEGDSYSMAAAILELINNYEYAKLIGENARKKAFLRHDPNKIIDNLIKTYKAILSENEK